MALYDAARDPTDLPHHSHARCAAVGAGSAAVRRIGAATARPGRAYSAENQVYVAPEVTVHYIDGDYTAYGALHAPQQRSLVGCFLALRRRQHVNVRVIGNL